jgi:adenosylcobinamide-GDP ribazoletransferase
MAFIPAAAFTLAVAIALLGWGGIATLAVATFCALAVGWYATRLLGGVTGDIYGASVEITEACTLLFVAALANRNWIEAWLLG